MRGRKIYVEMVHSSRLYPPRCVDYTMGSIGDVPRRTFRPASAMVTARRGHPREIHQDQEHGDAPPRVAKSSEIAHKGLIYISKLRPILRALTWVTAVD